MTTTRRIGSRYWLLTGVLLLASGVDAHAGFIALTATLTGTQETPPNSSPGTGSAAFILDDVNHTLVSAVTFSGLTGETTSADIQAGPGQPPPIVHPFPVGPAGFPIDVTQGSFTDIWTGLLPGNIAALESGSYFIAIRTSAFPGGEIRGQIVVPEPASVVMGATAALVGLGYAWRRRRRAIA